MIYDIESEPFHFRLRQYIYCPASVEPGILLFTCPSHRMAYMLHDSASIHSFLILMSRQDICYNRNPKLEAMSPMVTSHPNVLQCYMTEASIHHFFLPFSRTHLLLSQSSLKSHSIPRSSQPRCTGLLHDLRLDAPLFCDLLAATSTISQSQAKSHPLPRSSSPRIDYPDTVDGAAFSSRYLSKN